MTEEIIATFVRHTLTVDIDMSDDEQMSKFGDASNIMTNAKDALVKLGIRAELERGAFRPKTKAKVAE